MTATNDGIIPLRGVIRGGKLVSLLDHAGKELGAPVTSIKNDVTGRIGIYGGAYSISVQQEMESMALDVLDLTAVSPTLAVAFTSPYAAGGDATLDAMTANQRTWMAHPSILFTPGGFAGYPYWAAVTPYPNSNSAYENPCIFRSYDGVTWEVPAGLTNPIVQKPATGYNADNFLFLSPTRLTMYLVYRERLTSGATVNNLRLMSSTDGVTWTAPVTILTGALGAQDFASPSINWTGNTWELISHNLDSGGFPIQLRVSNSADLTAGWGAPTTLTIANPRGATWWHSDFRLTENGYTGVMVDGNSGGGALYWATSPDKIRWGTARITRSISHYKSGWCFANPSNAGAKLWLGVSSPTFSINVQMFAPGRVSALKAALAVQYSIAGSAPRLIGKDSFTRADSAVSPGTPEIGSAYVIDAGTWGISTNRLYAVSTGNNKLFFETSKTSHEITATIQTAGTSYFVLAGIVDTDNYVRVGESSGPKVQVISGGGVSSTVDLPGLSSGDVITVRKLGARVIILINDVVQYDAVVTAIALGTKVGVQSSGASLSYIDNLSVIDLG